MNPRGRLLGRAVALVLGLALVPAVGAVNHRADLATQAQAAVNSTITDSPVGKVNEVAVGPDDTTYVVGNFTRVGAATGGFASLDPTTGLVNRSFPPVTGRILVMESDGNGGMFIGGTFTSIDGQARSSLARILADGTLDTNWTPTVSAGYAVVSMARVGTTLYIGGEFSSINGTARANLAAINTTNGSLLSWNPGADFGVYSMATDDSALYIGGNFQTVDGQTRNRIAAFNLSNGALVSTWNPNANLTVFALEARNGVVYAGGAFSTIGGVSQSYLAALEAVASGDDTVTSWNPGPGQQVNTFALDDTTIYVGGAFTNVGGATRNRLAAFRTDDTGTLLTWNPNANDQVKSIHVTANSVYLGGYFTTVNGGTSRSRLAQVDKSAGNATGWNPDAGSSGNVELVGSFASGAAILAGGNFTHLNVVTRNYAAAFDSSGRVTSWAPSMDCEVSTIAIATPLAYLGGCFTTLNGVSRTRAAAVRIDDAGSVTAWDPRFNNQVFSLAVVGSTIYAVGNFTLVNGSTTRNRAAAISTLDDSLATAWDPNLSSVAEDIEIGGSIAYIGGQFTTVKGGATTRNRVAAFTVDDTANPTAWDPNANGTVYDVELTDSTVYLAGAFTTVNGGTTRSYAAAVSRSGSGTATAWNPNVTCSNLLSNSCFGFFGPAPGGRAIQVSGSTAYLAGNFTTVGGASPYRGLVALQTDDTGTITAGWLPTVYIGNQGVLYGLAIAGGQLMAVGEFQGIGLSNVGYASNVARLPLAASAPVAPTGVAATAGNASASIAWTAGSNGGSPVTRVEFALDDTATVDDSTTNTVSPHTISGLTNGTAYTVYVRLVNVAGAGAWSTASAPFTPRASTPPPPIPVTQLPPGAPTGVVATPSDRSATVSWNPPTFAGTSPISRYVVESQPGGRTCLTASTTCTVDGLANGTPYAFTVTAVNNAGGGPASDPSEPVTPRTVSGSPGGVAAVAGDRQATVTWSVPSDSGGSPITGYRVATSPASAGCQTTVLTCTITGLANGQEYAVTVIAVNAAGDSAPSAPATVVPHAQGSIVITGSRGGRDPRMARIEGTVAGMSVTQVRPFRRLAGQRDFEAAIAPAPVSTTGRFTWQRLSEGRIWIYVVAGEIRSNTVSIRPLGR